MPSPYDFQAFLARVSRLDLAAIVAAANEECRQVEAASFGARGAPRRRAEGSIEFATKLKQFLFFLQHCTKPGGVDANDFRSYEPLVRSLVAKGQLSDSHLKILGQGAP